jgi:ADP-heptose:LPS heptosyltransferase
MNASLETDPDEIAETSQASMNATEGRVDEPASKSGPVITEQVKKHVDAYTLETRKFTEDPAGKTPINVTVRMFIESLNRRAWSKLLKYVFRNPQEFDRIPIEKLESLFVIPFGDAIGDLILTLPMLKAVKRRNPNVRIGTFISPRNETLLRCETAIDDKYFYANHIDLKNVPSIWKARKKDYQVVVSLRFNRMTEFGIIANLLSPHALKAVTTHQRGDLYAPLFNRMAPYHRNSMHLSQYGLELLGMLVSTQEPFKQWESMPSIKVCEDVQTKVDAKISEQLKALNASWFIYFNTQARNPFREWGTANIAKFTEAFERRYPDGAIFFTASPVRHEEVKREIASHTFRRASFFETSYDLLELAALTQRARIVMTPDTSLIHFGAAMRRPTMILWPDKQYLPMEWLPIGVPAIHLAPEVHGEPVSAIPFEEVWKAACELIDGVHQVSNTSYDRSATPIALYQSEFAQSPLHELVLASLVLGEDGKYTLPQDDG